jgi:TolB-like protein
MGFFTELKRRNVVRVGIAYVIVGWLLAQIAEFAVENFGAPDWVLKIFVVFLILGLPLVLLFAWAFELTPEGIKLEKNVDRDESITPQTGRKLDFIIIGVMALALIYMVADKFIAEPTSFTDAESGVPAQKSIAVLPFVNMSDDKDYFADGLSEELLNLLARIPDLKVAGRTSSFAFKGKNDDLRAIGDALSVNTVLEGSVRRSGDRLRVTAQLINVEDGFHIWSDTYDREMADIFEIQDDVAGAITTALQLHLDAGTSSGADRPTQNTEAYTLYLEAIAMFQEVDDPLLVIELLDRALVLDPQFAKAHERKAILYWTAAAWTLDSPTAQKLVYESAKTALSIDPTSVIARSFMATADPVGWNWSKELEAIEWALDEMPNDVSLLNAYCWDLAVLGYFRESLQCADRMINAEPLACLGYARKGAALSGLNRHAEAYAAWQKCGEFGIPGWRTREVFDHLVRNEDEEAIQLMDKLYRDHGVRFHGLRTEEFRSFVESARHPETGEEFLRDAVARMVVSAPSYLEEINSYLWYLAFGALEPYYDVIDEMNEIDTGWTNSDILEAVGRFLKGSGYAAHPRFMRGRNRWGMLDLWEQRGPPDDCQKTDGNWVCE